MGFWFGKGQDRAISLNCRPEDSHPFSASSRNDNQGSLYSHPTRPNIQKLLFHLWFSHGKKKKSLQQKYKKGLLVSKPSPFFLAVWQVMSLYPFNLWFIYWKKILLCQHQLSYQEWLLKENIAVKKKEVDSSERTMTCLKCTEPEQTGLMYSSSVDWSGKSAIRPLDISSSLSHDMTQSQWDSEKVILVQQVAAAQQPVEPRRRDLCKHKERWEQLDEVQGLLDAANQLCDSLQTWTRRRLQCRERGQCT